MIDWENKQLYCFSMVLQIYYISDWCSYMFSCALWHIEDVRRTILKLSKLWKSHVLVMFVHNPGTFRASLPAMLITSYRDREAVWLPVSPARPNLQLLPPDWSFDVLIACPACNARHSHFFFSDLTDQHEDTGSFKWKSFRGEKDEKEAGFQITNGRQSRRPMEEQKSWGDCGYALCED